MFRPLKSAVLLLVICAGFARPLSAATIFYDNFNRAIGKTVGGPSNGDPWTESNVDKNDVAIVKGGFSGEKGDNALLIRESTDFARQLSISTQGFSNIQLSFDWIALSPSESNDVLSVGWRIATSSVSVAPFEQLAVYGLGDRPPFWHSVSNLSLSGANNLGSPPYLQLQFRINVDKSNEGVKIDNVRVTGTEIPVVFAQDNPAAAIVMAPEPGSFAVWGLLAFAAAVGGSRRRSVP
jgi:MYXO-CTERM domain-containing protein